MNRLAKKDIWGPLEKVNLSHMEHCLVGKTTRKKPFGKGTCIEIPLQLIHSDICGPMNIRARHEAIYFITFIDDYMCFNYVYLISHKSEVLNCFRWYINLVEN